MLLRLRDDPVHDLDCLNGVFSNGGFPAQHHRICAVEDRVRHIACFRARRPRILDHRLEHLCRNDHRFAELVAFPDDHLLQERHILRRKLNTEIAPGNHDCVGLFQDFIDVLNRLVLFDLRNNGYFSPFRPFLYYKVSQGGNIVRPPNERQGDVVNVVFEREHQIGLIFFCQGGRRDFDAGEIDPFVSRQQPSGDNPKLHVLAVNTNDLELDLSVVQEYAVSNFNIFGKVLISRG